MKCLKKVKVKMSSMELIKKLRDTTGSGIVDCKKALAENNNDLEAAVKWLREKGILKAQKKQNRETNEGVVSFFNNSSNTEFTVCKIKCETDFVAKNNDFLNFAETLTKTIHENKKLNNEGTDGDLSELVINHKPFSVCLTDLISKIGENIQIVSFKKYYSENSIFISYLHNKYNTSCSKIASVVEISTNDQKSALKLVDVLLFKMVLDIETSDEKTYNPPPKLLLISESSIESIELKTAIEPKEPSLLELLTESK